MKPTPPLTALGLFLLAAVLAWGGCAIVGRPQGGTKDVTGPVLDTLASSPNFVTGVRPEELVLEFDEFVVLKNASQDILLTPVPPSGKPSYVQRGRRVTVDFAGVTLSDSTTYQLQFGDAVQDLNEGNPAAALRYVFSTGSFLDSLRVRGRVRDSQTDAVVPEAVVGLYRYAEDSLGFAAWTDVVVRDSPDYFTKTDSSGRFLLDYLAPGSYYLAAYTDENANYRFNAGTERLAFLDTTVRVAAELPDTSYALVVSPERPPLIALRAEQVFPGLLRITLNQAPPADFALLDAGLGEQLATYAVADSFFVAYAPAVDSLGEVVVASQGEVDTVRVRAPARATRPALALVVGGDAVPGTSILQYNFSQPLRTVRLDSIVVLLDDSTRVRGRFAVDSADRRVLTFVPPSDTVPSYEVRLLPGALTSVFDSVNRDTIAFAARPNSRAGRGEVSVTLEGLEDKAYVVELVDDRDRVERTIRLPVRAAGAGGPREETIALPRVSPGVYTLRLTDDDDGDGRYSPGSRRLGRQPERVRRFPLEQVRPDWTVEERVLTAGRLLDDAPVLEELLD